MSVDLTKATPYPVTDDIDQRYAWGMDNESWNSTVLLPMYMRTVFGNGKAQAMYQALSDNMLDGLYVTLHFEHHYDNASGKLV